MPSILLELTSQHLVIEISFKPYYNWNAFNTSIEVDGEHLISF